MKRVLLTLALCLPLIPLAACKPVATTHPLAPGAINATDQTIYSALMVAQASLNSLKESVPANPVLKPYVNQAITDYNMAELAWQAYHAALSLDPSTSPAVAQAALSKVQADLSTAPKVKP